MNRCLIFPLIFLIAGCGYTTRGFTYKEDTIIVEPVANKIDVTAKHRKTSGFVNYPVLIDNRLTNELVNHFNIDGSLKVVSQDPEALRLSCEVTNYTKETLRYTASDEVREQRLRLHVRMKLLDSEGQVLKQKNVVGQSTYFLSGPRRRTESAAQNDLIQDTARRISEAVIEAW
jgi:outer membrane lipopolysaccharide assembly protein LptE/RlpB